MTTGESNRLVPAAARLKAKRLLTETWQSDANLSVFLVLLVLVSFVLPVLGFIREHLKAYADIAFTLMLASGVAFAWGRPRLLLLAGSIAVVNITARYLDLVRPSPTGQLWTDGLSVAAIS